jgi:toxin YoeB
MKTGTEGSSAYFRTKGFKGPRGLIKEIQRDAFVGIGKPEPLKQALSGYWSRRITEEHRIVYKVVPDAVCIAQFRYYY